MERKLIKLAAADDHFIFREGLKTLLRPIKHIELVAVAGCGNELLEAAVKYAPDVVLMDIQMPDTDGIAATRALRENGIDAKVIALTMYNHEWMVIDMLDAGAIGYLLKNTTREELVRAIETVYHDVPYFCPAIAERLTQLLSRNQRKLYKPSTDVFLTEREKEIIRLICIEYTSKEIAAQLHLSKRTVEGHRLRIMDKLGARSIAGLITYAVTRGIFTLEQEK